jgi:hypothetical protein
MMLYLDDVIECEGTLYRNIEALLSYAKQNPSEFLVFKNIELHEVELDEDARELKFTYNLVGLDDDEDDSVNVESFDICRWQMVTSHLI